MQNRLNPSTQCNAGLSSPLRERRLGNGISETHKKPHNAKTKQKLQQNLTKSRNCREKKKKKKMFSPSLPVLSVITAPASGEGSEDLA